MKIFVSHSRKFDFENELYEPLKHSDLAKKATLIFPQADGDVYHDTKKIIKECRPRSTHMKWPGGRRGHTHYNFFAKIKFPG